MSKFQILKQQQGHMVANDFNDLMNMAQSGLLLPGDLVQPDGSDEWLYAGELPKIKDHLSFTSSTKSSFTNNSIGITLLIVAFVLFGVAYQFSTQIPSKQELEFIGGNGLQENQALLTKNTTGYKIPKGDQASRMDQLIRKGTKVTLAKMGTIVTLLDKKGEYFKVKSPEGEIWVSMHDLAPAYLFANNSIRNKYDAQFNAHRKLNALNASWERPEYGSATTNFTLQLQNLGIYDVEDVIVSIEMKDASDEVVKTLKLEIEGKIIAGDTSVIGTLLATKNSDEEPRIMTRNQLIELEKTDPSIIDRWVEHIEVILEKIAFKGAKIEVTQANALVTN